MHILKAFTVAGVSKAQRNERQPWKLISKCQRLDGHSSAGGVMTYLGLLILMRLTGRMAESP